MIFNHVLVTFAAIENSYHLSLINVKLNKSSLSSAILLSLSTSVMAEGLMDKEMETIVVSGTKTPKLLSNSPVAIEVIEGEVINMITKGTLAQALDFIPGVVITRSVKDGYNVQMQGFSSKHVLILIDGQPLISPTGSSADLDQISADNIAQIEVIKGAASVMYGSNAMGGVINIITNKEADEFVSATYEAGSFLDNALSGDSGDSLSHLVKVSAGKEAFDLFHKFNVQVIKNAGFDYDEESVSQNAADLDKVFINYGTAKQFAHVNAAFKYQYFEENKKRATGRIPGQSGFIYYQSDVDQHQFDLNLVNAIDNWKLNTRYITHEEVSGQSNSLRNTEIGLVELDGLKTWQFGDVTPNNSDSSGSELVTGFATSYETLDQIKPASNSIEIDDKSRDNVSAYAQYNWIKQNYQILVGVRGQDDSDFGFESAARISGMLDLGDHDAAVKIRGGFGQGYRVPDLKERFYVFDHSNLGYKVLGDENLTPEKSDTYNLSLDYRTEVLDNLGSYSLSIATHYSETEDLISTVVDPTHPEAKDLIISRYTNIESAKIQGFDISNELTFDNWLMQLSYSYVDSEDQDGLRLEDRPRHQIKANLGYDFEQWKVNTLLYLVYQSDEVTPSSYKEQEVNGYTIVNLKLNQELTSNLSWHLALDNIFNEHQSSKAVSQGKFDPRPVSSRELRLGATYKF